MNTRPISQLALAIALSLPLALVFCPPARANDAGAPRAADDTLYRALGSQPGLVKLIDDFVPRLVHDPRLASFFEKTNLDELRKHLVGQFCVVTGGPCTYEGAPMKVVHQDFDIRKVEFNALVEDLQQAMDAQGIPFPTQNMLLAKLAPMHREIVNTH